MATPVSVVSSFSVNFVIDMYLLSYSLLHVRRRSLGSSRNLSPPRLRDEPEERLRRMLAKLRYCFKFQLETV